MIIGAPTFPDGAAEQDDVVPVERRWWCPEWGTGVLLLLLLVAGHGGVVAERVRVCGFDAVGVDVEAVADHSGDYLGVADLEVAPVPVPVVLTGPGEVRQQHPRACGGFGCRGCGGLRLLP